MFEVTSFNNTVDPVAKMYKIARNDGLIQVDAFKWIMPMIEQHPKPQSEREVDERIQLAEEFENMIENMTSQESVQLTYSMFPQTVTYPGWIVAGLLTEMLSLFLDQELAALTDKNGLGATGADELRAARRKNSNVRNMIASILKDTEAILTPLDQQKVQTNILEELALISDVPLSGNMGMSITSLLSLISQNLSIGDALSTISFSIEPELLLSTGMALALLGDGDSPAKPKVESGKKPPTKGKGADKSDQEKKPSGPKVKVTVKTDGKGKPEVELGGEIEITPSSLEKIGKFIGKTVSSVLVFWLFVD